MGMAVRRNGGARPSRTGRGDYRQYGGTNTRRVRRALAGLFGGKLGKDAVSRAWRKVKTDWESWQARDLSGEDIVRLILDGTGVKARLDGRVLSIPLLVVLGVRRDGQKVLLAVKNMGGETEAAWRHVLEDLLGRGLKAPELLIVDGGKGLEAALASLWSDIPVQRCTVHKERNLLAHAPKALHDEVKADYTDMMYAENAEQVRKKRKAFLAKWRLRCRGVSGCSPSCAIRRSNGSPCGPPTPSNACTGNSSAG